MGNYKTLDMLYKNIILYDKKCFGSWLFENKDKVYHFKAEKDKKLKALMRLKYTTLIDLKNRFLNKNFEIEKIKKG